MALKSVIDIDVNDKAFKEFHALYQRYQQQLRSMPKVWGEVNKQIDGSKKTFQGLIAGMIAERFHQQAIMKAQKEVDRLTRSTADSWKEIGRHSSSFVGSLGRITHTMGRLAKDLGIFGLVGAGGLYGIDQLATGVGERRKRAQALGLTFGQSRAFSLNYERLLPGGSDSLLEAVSQARGTAEGKAALFGAGLTQRDLQGNTADVASKLITRLKPLFDRTNENLLGNVVTARRLEQLGIDVNFARLIRSTSSKELTQITGGYHQDVGGLGLGSDMAKRFQDFSIQLSRAGLKIETAFIKGIDPLIPQLNKLSDAFEKVVVKLLGDKAFGHLIDVVTSGLEKLASYIGTPKFQEDVDHFVTGVDKVAKGIGRLATFIGSFFGETESKEKVAGTFMGLPYGIREGGLVDKALKFFGAEKLSGLDQGLSDRLTKLLAALPSELGPARITSGVRTADQQAALRRFNPSGLPVARGTSEHELGLAADVNAGPQALDWLHRHAREYGLEFPVRNDPVHVRKLRGDASPTITVKIQNETGANVSVTGAQIAR